MAKKIQKEKTKKTIDEFVKFLQEAYKKQKIDLFNPVPTAEKPCPNCGHCPTCGRGNNWIVAGGGSGGTWTPPNYYTTCSTPGHN